MKYKLKVYSIWEYGKRKDAEGNPHQEDCTFPLPNELKDSDRTFILCDGMGGHDAGEVASATVCETMGSYVLNDGHDKEGIFTDEDLKNAIAAAFSALDKKDSGAEKKMGTTMTFLKLHNNGVTIAHMGDSRVYHIRPGEKGDDTQILFETDDHSLVNDLIKIGELTKEEARTSKQKNVITRAMQPNMERKPKADIKHITDIKVGDFFYMCSDGMLEQEEMENGESIKNIFSNAIPSVDDKVTILKKVTENNKDNHTALIIHILDLEESVEKQEEKTKTTLTPSISIGLVEDDDASEETTSSKANTPSESEKSINEMGNSFNGNPQNETEKIDDKESDNRYKADNLANEDYPKTNSVVPANKKTPTRKLIVPKSKSIFSKMILRGVLVAIIVAACIVGINYILPCSEKNGPNKVEHPQGKKDNSNKRNVSRGESRQKPQNHGEAPDQEQAQEIALDAANSNAAQVASGEDQQQSNGSSGNATVTIQLPTQSGVVSSDQQTIQETVNK